VRTERSAAARITDDASRMCSGATQCREPKAGENIGAKAQKDYLTIKTHMGFQSEIVPLQQGLQTTACAKSGPRSHFGNNEKIVRKIC